MSIPTRGPRQDPTRAGRPGDGGDGGPARAHRVSGRRLDASLVRASAAAHRAIEPMLPVQCAVCREPGRSLCRACRRLLRRSCARPHRVGSASAQLRGLPVVAAGAYEFELAVCLMALKDGGRTDLLGELAPVLAAAVRAALGDACGGAVLVPIPTSARALRRRWFDPVQELLRRARRDGLLPGCTSIEPWLGHRSRRAGAAAAGLGARAAAQKTRDAAGRARAEDPFEVVRPRGRTGPPPAVVLVDDVLTTGATLRRAADRLEATGLRVRGAVVLAAVRAPSAGPADDDDDVRVQGESPMAGR
ncbi:ComF family protein [Kocuria palustris]|uniref:ComF family protein n=1 Tax=Kocuria palustris TaxID=71999 RepID=UPI00119E0217|nr:phosphoribosyltransferase family protein [Kocuria palustris]